ncbi:L-erythrulose-1-phosphate isomerase [Acetobacteraceae bacterium EV16G]|uniref:Triosephosphate isomerase n=2 Tax=Sorlinia euscelidii TaxID=3081148 RepID=A0ABU7U435_9PROT
MRSKPLWVGTSWKMNKTPGEARQAAEALAEIALPSHISSFVIPPFTSIADISRILEKSPFQVGAQNMHWEDEGAWTGEISAPMIKESGATIVEVGHSERRTYFNETDVTVNLKVAAAVRHGLTPLICIGDTAEDHHFSATHETLARQARIALHGLTSAQVCKVLFAYEPVWAIGAKGRAAAPDFVQDAHARLRQHLTEIYGAETARAVNILYGGSVSLQNAAQYVGQKDIDGIFIGRAAWAPKDFAAIIEACAASSTRQ